MMKLPYAATKEIVSSNKLWWNYKMEMNTFLSGDVLLFSDVYKIENMDDGVSFEQNRWLVEQRRESVEKIKFCSKWKHF